MSLMYKDLVQFEPLESVIELTAADEKEKARDLVRTYVISNEMAEKLSSRVFSQLQYDRSADNKGLFIVGNYGTGKSHLMSVVSAIAEHEDLLADITNDKVRQSAKSIAGRFQVIRTEVGTVTRPLYDVLTDDINRKLKLSQVDYTFPSSNQLVNYKEALSGMMEAFHQQYPDQGLLLVVDELLEFLRSRKEQEIILDLGFLREIGEFCKDSRLRFIAGIQETLFDNPRFQFVANSISRVKDRFEQLLIARRDVKFVVAQRLLKKTAEQQHKIRAYLSPFAPFYGSMNERMDEFVNLFPVHPDYIDILERISAIEKREILKMISQEMRGLLEKSLPEGKPGLFSYSQYWGSLRANSSYRANPDIRAVIECSEVLENRVRLAFTRPAYKDMALDIIYGLSVQRLTTNDINAPIGPTPEELRDGLCLYHPGVAQLGGEPAADLLSQVEVVLREILKTVNGQFISFNPQNRQYYLDLKKTEDYEALIEKKAETLDDSFRDRYYFEALKVVLECTTTTVITGYKIWEHELEWRERKAGRLGYLFFGAPNERSTAQPPRDFYLYFMPHFDQPPYKDEKKPDELFFRLTNIDQKFHETLNKYAGAMELASTASGSAKRAYEDKGRSFLSLLIGWFQEKLLDAFSVTYEGRSRPLLEWLKSGKINNARLSGARDTINAVAGVALAPHFEQLAPEYPAFASFITFTNRQNGAEQALRWLRGSKTQQGANALDALKLLDGERLTPRSSPYALYILDTLNQKGVGQVLNRSDIITQLYQGVEYLLPERFRLEPEWVVVLLVALVYNGDIVLAIPGKKFDATSLDQLQTVSFSDLLNFRLIERPKDWNVPALRALCELLGLDPGRAQLLSLGQGQDGLVQDIQSKVGQWLPRVVKAQQKLAGGLPIWNRKIVDGAVQTAYRQKLDSLKQFLDSLQNYSTPGKLKNFRYSETEVQAQRVGLSSLTELEGLDLTIAELVPLVSYLGQAENLLPPAHPALTSLRSERYAVLSDLEDPDKRGGPAFRGAAVQRLLAVKRTYIKAYLELHVRSRLGANESRRFSGLRNDVRLNRLKLLSTIPLLPNRQLKAFQDELAKLKECSNLTDQELDSSPLCPYCQFQPITQLLPASIQDILGQLDDQLDVIISEWTTNLLTSLEAESIQTDLARGVFKPGEKRLIETFLDSRQLPAEMGQDFVEAVKTVLSGLQRLTIFTDSLLEALLKGGSPVEPAEFRQRFSRYLEELLRHKTEAKIRLVLEKREKDDVDAR